MTNTQSRLDRSGHRKDFSKLNNVVGPDGSIIDPYRNFIALSRYSRWLEKENRRETWVETVNRYVDFMLEHLKLNNDYVPDSGVVEMVREYITNHMALPSMRALMTAGPALSRNGIAAYNCSFISMDDTRAFDEILYILMNGTGVGFSAESKYTSKLPVVSETFENVDDVIVVADSKEGWAHAYRLLIESLYNGKVPSWNTEFVRPAGTRLKTFGGRASGPEPLEDLFRFTVDTFTSAPGRRLSDLEVHDIVCKIASVVVVGGVRRCLVGQTIISTPSGMVRMSDIKVGDYIYSGGRKARVSAKVDSGRQETVIVRHAYGSSEMTPNHRVAVFDSVDSYTFKEAGDLEAGDRLVWDLVGTNGVPQELPRSNYKGHFNAKPFAIPSHVDTDLAWLIGQVHGDGWVGEKSIDVSSNVDEWGTMERLAGIFMSSFGVTGTVGRDSHDGNGIRLRVNSAGLSRWFADNVKVPNEAIRIPEFIRNATREIRAAYLAGVLDSDGRVRVDNGIEVATTVYKEYSEDLVDLLTSLGIPSKVYAGLAQARRDTGVKAQDFYSVNVATRTGFDRFRSLVSPFADTNIPERLGDTGEFSYPASWGLVYRNRATRRTTAISAGILDEACPFAPAQVISVDRGSVEQTWDIEVEGIHEFTADGIVTHNSALISLGDLDSEGHRSAKSGEWWVESSHRALANNSAVYNSKPDRATFDREWQALIDSGSGERGIFNLDASRRQAAKNGRRNADLVAGTNPCSEIILRNNQFCNLSTVVVRENDTIEDLEKKVTVAATLGTWQSTITNFRYIRDIWRENTEEERLLGVSMTGPLVNSLLNGNLGMDTTEKVLNHLRELSVEVNAKVAAEIGIPQSTAVTCVKPEGTSSQVTGTSSGLHAWHSKHYIRTVRGDKKDAMSQFLTDSGVYVEDDVMNPSTSVFHFPIKAPEGAITRHELPAMRHLELWLTYQRAWCEHKPSVTVYVKEDEWGPVGDWVFEHFDEISGISFLPSTDHTYAQAPYQDLTESEYNEWIKKTPAEINWKLLSLYETDDQTTATQELSCIAGSCESVDIVSSTS